MAIEQTAIHALQGRRMPVVPARAFRWLVALGLVSICGLLSVLLGPDNYWDLRYYHLENPALSLCPAVPR